MKGGEGMEGGWRDGWKEGRKERRREGREEEEDRKGRKVKKKKLPFNRLIRTAWFQM